MQDRKRHDGQDRFSEITKAILVVELKSCEHLTGEHQAQLINSLAATNLSVGILANFGKRKLEYKRVHHPAHHAACDHANPVSF